MVSAQAQTTDSKPTEAKPATAVHELNNCVVMRGDQVWLMKDGATTKLDKEMTMKNGTKVMTNGDYVTKDGKKMKLENGQYIDMDGNVVTYLQMKRAAVPDAPTQK